MVTPQAKANNAAMSPLSGRAPRARRSVTMNASAPTFSSSAYRIVATDAPWNLPKSRPSAAADSTASAAAKATSPPTQPSSSRRPSDPRTSMASPASSTSTPSWRNIDR